MNIWLKAVDINDDDKYCDLLIELASYHDAYARPVPRDFTKDDFDTFKKARIKMANGVDLPSYVVPTSTYFIMDGEYPVGYATLKHKIDPNVPGGHFGCCLKKEYQNKGIGGMVSEMLSNIAYYDLGIEKVIYTSKCENIQSQRSVHKIGATLIGMHDGYYFYEMDLVKKYSEEGKKNL